MEILVTGINGFVGHHLAHELKKQGHTVCGVGTDAELSPDLEAVVEDYFGNCDLTQPTDVAKLPLGSLDAVINLAGLAQVGASFGQAETYMRVNVDIHTVLAEHLLKIGKTSTRIVAISTGAVYDSDQPMPLHEASRLATKTSPYAQSKIAMEAALGEYREQGLDIIIARPFNHIGPGQREGFLVPDLTHQVLSSTIMKIGNLKTERDYTDVRDVARAYVLLATIPKLTHTLYNICSGHSVSGQTILDTIVTVAGKRDLAIEIDKARIRPNDPAKIVGDNHRIMSDTSWRPTIPLEQTIQDYITDLKD